MANMKHLSFCLLVVMLVAHEAKGTVQDCNQVTGSLVSCVQYIQSGGSIMVSPSCCAGVGSLNEAAQSTADRQTVCGCLKQLANAFPNMGVASSIPGKCGINLPYKLDPNTDCASVH